MKIQWLGHSSFRILGSKSVITDPFGEIGLSSRRCAPIS